MTARTSTERSAAYRQRQRDEREALRTAARASAATVMRDAVETALGAMRWLQVSDAGVVAQARRLAYAIDMAEHLQEYSVALNAHGRLTGVLRQLGGTPATRMALELRAGRVAPSAPLRSVCRRTSRCWGAQRSARPFGENLAQRVVDIAVR